MNSKGNNSSFTLEQYIGPPSLEEKMKAIEFIFKGRHFIHRPFLLPQDICDNFIKIIGENKNENKYANIRATKKDY